MALYEIGWSAFGSIEVEAEDVEEAKQKVEEQVAEEIGLAWDGIDIAGVV